MRKAIQRWRSREVRSYANNHFALTASGQRKLAKALPHWERAQQTLQASFHPGQLHSK